MMLFIAPQFRTTALPRVLGKSPKPHQGKYGETVPGLTGTRTSRSVFNGQFALRFIEVIDFDYGADDATSALLTAGS